MKYIQTFLNAILITIPHIVKENVKNLSTFVNNEHISCRFVKARRDY